MIGEDKLYFYSPTTNQGCAHGAAWAAIGVLERQLDGLEHSELFFPICALLVSEEECRILVGDPAGFQFNSYFGKGAIKLLTLGAIVSVAHDTDRLPCLELARRIRIVEDMHPEIPGSIQGSHDSREEAAMARVG